MIKYRPYNDDYGLIMGFLREMYMQTQTQRCWLPQRWEYAAYFVNPLYIERGADDWCKYIRIWEEDRRVVAVCHKEEGSNAYLQIRPGYEALTNEMLDFAEEAIALRSDTGKKSLSVWSTESNAYLNNCLTARGYVRGDDGNYYNSQELDKEYHPQLPPGYTLVTAVEMDDALSRFRAVHDGFHPDEGSPMAVTDSFYNMERAPLFRPELEIMTRNEAGLLTSFCVAWYDEQTKIGMFEPVATLQEHRRLGLGKAILVEGLRRLQAMGVERAYVESYGDDRKAFYNSAGFVTYDKDWPWKKEF